MHRNTVFVVDDEHSVRDALSLLLSLRGYATATFASAEDFIGALQPEWHGCIVADIRMSGMSGLEMQQRLRDSQCRLPIIFITAHGDVAAARQAFLAEAVDFIEKPFDGEVLLSAIDKAMSSSPPPAQSSDPSPSGASTRQLSPREHEVMGLMMKGMHNRGIAEALQISPRTVEVHKARVLEKHGVRSVLDLVRLLEQGPG